MRPLLAVAIAFGLYATSVAQSDLPVEVLHRARVRANVEKAIRTLPDFVCLATTERYRSPKRGLDPVPVDVIRLDVAHTGNKELFSWPGRDAFEDRDATEFVRYGLTSSGSFASHLRAVFVGRFAVVRFAGEEEIHGRAALRWDYDIPLYASGWVLSDSTGSVQISAHGSFWADPTTDDILRLEVRGAEIPPAFSMTAVTQVIDYARMEMAGRQVLLPQEASATVLQADGITAVNRTAYSHCRQYGASTVLTFDESGTTPIPETQRVHLPRRKVQLPAGLTIPLRLNSAVHSGSAVGDPITARLRPTYSLRMAPSC